MEGFDGEGEGFVAHGAEHGGGEEAVGVGGVAGDEDEFVLGDAIGGEFEEVVDVRGLVVFVGAHEGDVEAVAGVFEVVGVAAEEGGLEFGGEDEADVGVAFVAIEVVEGAAVESDDGGVIAGFLQGFVFDGGEDGVAGFDGGIGGEGWGDGGVDASGDVFDGEEDGDFLAGEFDFIGAGVSEEAVGDVVVGGGGDVVEAAEVATWWLVRMRPSGETKAPEAPMWTEASWRFSIHCWEGEKAKALRRSRGGRWGSHMPSV